MLIWTARLPKKKLLLGALLFAVAAACILLMSPAPAEDVAAGELRSNEDRIAYLGTFGWDVAPEPVEILQITLPDTLEEPYRSYNELQKSQGFDLTESLGQPVSRYTYQIRNYPLPETNAQLNLYVRDGLPVAGDVVVLGDGGFQDGLAFPGT